MPTQHVVFVVKFFVAWMIPDVPSEVKARIKRERYLIQEYLHNYEVEKLKLQLTHGTYDATTDTGTTAATTTTTCSELCTEVLCPSDTQEVECLSLSQSLPGSNSNPTLQSEDGTP